MTTTHRQLQSWQNKVRTCGECDSEDRGEADMAWECRVSCAGRARASECVSFRSHGALGSRITARTKQTSHSLYLSFILGSVFFSQSIETLIISLQQRCTQTLSSLLAYLGRWSCGQPITFCPRHYCGTRSDCDISASMPCFSCWLAPARPSRSIEISACGRDCLAY